MDLHSISPLGYSNPIAKEPSLNQLLAQQKAQGQVTLVPYPVNLSKLLDPKRIDPQIFFKEEKASSLQKDRLFSAAKVAFCVSEFFGGKFVGNAIAVVLAFGVPMLAGLVVSTIVPAAVPIAMTTASVASMILGTATTVALCMAGNRRANGAYTS
ncbi:MAG: hypothetical protein K0S07_1424 [Chlamydiales bacterium]|jgi:hypothetical protein|nr:hypothetical protein [Chlamydiales bacterium]